jgi:peroxiredoxin Q/BCP
MAQLRQDYAQFVERDTEVIAIGPERRGQFARYWQEHEMPFVGIPDPRHIVAKLYGQEVRLLKMGRLPAQVIVDKTGRVRYVHYGRSMSDISHNDELLALLDEINQEDEMT